MTYREVKRPKFVTMHIDSLLRSQRESMYLTQKELAYELGIDQKNISFYENGYTYPTQSNYNKLAEIFHWQKWE